MNTTQNQLGYETCFVAFLDILGFGKLVKVSEELKEGVAKIKDCLSVCSAYPEAGGKGVTNSSGSRNIAFRSLHFSDSVTIYCRENPNDLAQLFFIIRYLQDQLWEQGICLRGAITIGEMYWPPANEKLIFGPALIEAYNLERTIAVYPRIIISNLLEQYIQRKQPVSDSYIATQNNLNNAINRDFDGVAFLDLLNPDVTRKSGEWLDNSDNSFSIRWRDNMENNLGRVQDNILNLVNTNLDDRNLSQKVKSKYHWLKNYVERRN